MKNMKYLIIALALIAFLSVAAGATSWNSKLLVAGVPGSWIDVVTTATFSGPNWNWSYALTPVNSNGIQSIRINLLAPETALVVPFSWTQPVGWSFNTDNATYVAWDTLRNGPFTLDSSQAETFTFAFDHPYGPVEWHNASAQDGFGFFGPVAGPALVPEPMSMILGMLGLSSVAGFVKLRKK